MHAHKSLLINGRPSYIKNQTVTFCRPHFLFGTSAKKPSCEGDLLVLMHQRRILHMIKWQGFLSA